MGSLRLLFTNLTPGQNALIKRWKRDVYRTSQRGSDDPICDIRGPVVTGNATVQTFLTPAQVNQLVDDYLSGATVMELAIKYEVHRATVSRHLTDNGVVRRSAGLHGWEAAEAVRLFRQGESLRGISRSIGASRDSVRKTLEREREIPELHCRRQRDAAENASETTPALVWSGH